MAIWQDANGKLHDDMGGAAFFLPGWPTGLTQLSDAQVAALQPTAAQLAHQQLQAQAAVALDKTDIVAARCFKAGIAFPAAWQTYTQALRAIINGVDTTSTSLPTQPAYPAGT